MSFSCRHHRFWLYYIEPKEWAGFCCLEWWSTQSTQLAYSINYSTSLNLWVMVGKALSYARTFCRKFSLYDNIKTCENLKLVMRWYTETVFFIRVSRSNCLFVLHVVIVLQDMGDVPDEVFSVVLTLPPPDMSWASEALTTRLIDIFIRSADKERHYTSTCLLLAYNCW